MATPDWTTVPDTNLEPGDPIRSIDIIAINNHAAAMAGGATGSPEIKIMALETITAGATIRSRNDTEVSGTVIVVAHEFNFSQIGTVRVTAEHKTQSGGTPSVLTFYRTRNGTRTSMATWSTTSTTYVARSSDIDVLPGDKIEIEKSQTVFAANTFVRNSRFQTNGENLWPGSAVRLENDYTVV